MKKFFRGFLSILLAMTILTSVTSVSVVSTGAVTQEKSELESVSDSISDTSGKAYSLSEVYTEYLYPHTDKTSEVVSDKIVNEYDLSLIHI